MVSLQIKPNYLKHPILLDQHRPGVRSMVNGVDRCVMKGGYWNDTQPNSVSYTHGDTAA